MEVVYDKKITDELKKEMAQKITSIQKNTEQDDTGTFNTAEQETGNGQ